MTTAASIHLERALEEHIVEQLVALQGYVQRQPGDYDRTLALDKEVLVRFLKATQPEQWQRLEQHYSGSAEATLFKRIEGVLKQQGTLGLLRNGVKLVPDIAFGLSYVQPPNAFNPVTLERYQANILSVIRQVAYSNKNNNELDLVLFVNGVPVATLELKNNLTNSNIKTAEKQYRSDRSPAGEPLLTFKRGAFVHFAVDEYLVSMTTRLQNGKTHFLPFNRGRDGGAGNPDIEGDFRIAYLYCDLPEGKAIFGREVWLSIIHQFLHIQDEKKSSERLIFPRYHQLDAVRQILADAHAEGAGRNYLIQHSAGSGKSNTIGWVAHQLIKLHDAHEKPVFSSVIIVTDRVVLDKQLQSTVKQLEQTGGVVKKIDGTSRQLKEAIESGARIIVTTIQKFGTEHLKEVSGQQNRRFAIIVDEAHGSQSGKSAQALTDTLTRGSDLPEDVEAKVADLQRRRGPQANISFLAFTATPRNVTLERFGVAGSDGKPRPFHLYSMRQAIEEEFILDVLDNYITYRAYYELEKAIDEDPVFKTNRARKQVARFAHMHPTSIGQKVVVIVEHFREKVLHELDGQAKGMVVTGSRESALKYYLSIRDYIAEQQISNIKPLIAFSGELFVDGQTWTEAGLNGFSEAALPGEFDQNDAYRLLVVAEKYQTGFDQPKLCAMYIDRKLAGLQAVQTLSRLNRIAPGKRTFILDFQNTTEEIRDAFKPFYEATELETSTDPNQIFDLQSRLMGAGVLREDEVERFAAIYFRPEALTAYDRIEMQGIIQWAIERWQVIEEEALQEEFRQVLKSFVRFYNFIAQVVPLNDGSLEKLAGYGEWLLRLLPQREVPADIEVTDDMLNLRAFKVDQQEEGDASLDPGETEKLRGIEEFAGKPYTVEDEKSLSELVKTFNERFGTEFTSEEIKRFEQINAAVMADEGMVEMLRNNPRDVVQGAYADAFFSKLVDLFQKDNELQHIVLNDDALRKKTIDIFFNRALRSAQV